MNTFKRLHDLTLVGRWDEDVIADTLIELHFMGWNIRSMDQADVVDIAIILGGEWE